MRSFGLMLLATLIALGTDALGEPEPAHEETTTSLKEILGDRRAEFEERYGYDDWPNKDAEPLRLGRFMPLVQADGLSLKMTRIIRPRFLQSGNQFHFSDEMVWQSEPDGISEHRQWSAHIRMRIYTGAAEAQNAMMQKLSSPLISALPASPPALPYGQRIPGVGDVCFGSVSENGRGNIDCVTSNIWLTIKGGPEQASRDVSSEEDSDDDAILSISKLFVEKLHEADRETRAAEADGSRQAITFDFSRIKYDRRAREWVKAEKAPGRLKNEVEFENRENPESIIIRAMRSEGAPELVYEWAAVEGGRVRNEGMQQIQKMAIRLMSGEPGPRKVHYLAQYEDGSFEIVEDILVVHSSD